MDNEEVIEPAEKSSKYLTVLEKLRLARKSKTRKFIFVLVMLGAVVTGIFFTFYAFGFNLFSQEAPQIGGNLAALITIFIVLYLVQSLTLNVLPGTTTFFVNVLAIGIPVGSGLFGELHIAIIYAIIVATVLLSSIPLYFLGRYGGRNLLFWMFGKESVEKRLDWVGRNGTKGLPWLFLIPFMTTDLLCVISGASKMKFWQYMLIVVVFRPVEIAILVFLYPLILSGFEMIDPIIVFLIINIILINFVLLVIYHRTLLNIFNKTFQFRKLSDIAATQVAIMEAAELETQVALEAAEKLERDQLEQQSLINEVKLLRAEIEELKNKKRM